MSQSLSTLLANAALADLQVQGDISDLVISDIQLDSRKVRPGCLFAALPGTKVDGARFAANAVDAGAVAILAAPSADLGNLRGVERVDGARNAVVLRHPSPSYALSQLCGAFFTPIPKTLVAVTGTNGKTSVVNFLRQIWQASGQSAASIGTLGVLPKGLVNVPELTSPDAVTMGHALEQLAQRKIKCVALEASSHGLEQHRLHGLKFAAAGFTNLTQDHLDYHGDMDSYLAAKAKLFDDLNQGPAVVNVDHTPQKLMDALAAKATPIVRIGKAGSGRALDVSFDARPTPRGLSLILTLPEAGFSGSLRIVGLYQAENIAMAVGLALASGLHSDAIVEAVAGLSPAPGRMDWVASHPSGGPVLVDYAHTPDALHAAIAATRPHVRGKLIVVFGAGGDRDPLKRGPMGEAVAQGADVAIVTDDNPRGEDPAAIRQAILASCPKGLEIGDRRRAIAKALAMMEAGDGLLIAGKGHEQGQKIGDTVHPFDDLKVAIEEAGRVF